MKTIIFDLDGTIYQNTVFHKDYIRFMLENTALENWEDDLIHLTEKIFSGEELTMNCFYKLENIDAKNPKEFISRLNKNICLNLSTDDAYNAKDIIYLGDAWSVITLIGVSLGLLSNERADILFRRIRLKMEVDGMRGNEILKENIIKLNDKYNILLMSNSYEETVREFLRQLNYENVFSKICTAAKKPFNMIKNLNNLDENILKNSTDIISIGDHSFNDLMPISKLGGATVWINPYKNINRPKCDVELSSPDDLAQYLKTLL